MHPKPDVSRPPSTPVGGRAVAAPIRRQLPELYGLACRLVGSDAEAVVRECLRRASRDEPPPSTDASAWLRQILLGCVRDHCRSESRPGDADADAPPEGDADAVGPTLSALRALDDGGLWRLLDRLPVRERVALVLVGAEGTTAARAAELLGVGPTTLRSLLRRGHTRLRHELRAASHPGAGSHPRQAPRPSPPGAAVRS